MVVMRCLGASPTPGEVQRHLQIHGIGEWAGPDLAAGGEYAIRAGGWAPEPCSCASGAGPAGGYRWWGSEELGWTFEGQVGVGTHQ